MPDADLVIATTSDSQAVADAAARDDEKGSRVPEPETSKPDESGGVAWEHPRSERTLLLERLAAEADSDEAELRTLVSSTDKPGADSEQESEEGQEPAAADSLLPPDHPHAKRQKALIDHYGPDAYRNLISPGIAAMEAGLDINPGVAKEVASLENSAEVVFELMRDPRAILWLNEQSPSAAKVAVEKIANWVEQKANGVGAERDQGRARSAAPPPITPVRNSSTKSTVAPDDMPFQDFKRWREKQQKSRYQK